MQPIHKTPSTKETDKANRGTPAKDASPKAPAKVNSNSSRKSDIPPLDTAPLRDPESKSEPKVQAVAASLPIATPRGQALHKLIDSDDLADIGHLFQHEAPTVAEFPLLAIAFAIASKQLVASNESDRDRAGDTLNALEKLCIAVLQTKEARKDGVRQALARTLVQSLLIELEANPLASDVAVCSLYSIAVDEGLTALKQELQPHTEFFWQSLDQRAAVLGRREVRAALETFGVHLLKGYRDCARLIGVYQKMLSVGNPDAAIAVLKFVIKLLAPVKPEQEDDSLRRNRMMHGGHIAHATHVGLAAGRYRATDRQQCFVAVYDAVKSLRYKNRSLVHKELVATLKMWGKEWDQAGWKRGWTPPVVEVGMQRYELDPAPSYPSSDDESTSSTD
ncbi:MAG: hypothetical protein JWP36_1875 [Paucimonas sp.]|nr:hypothetical protein [Paucimonas sp.]